MNIDYTLWPNIDGNLGNIKVAIPDGVNVAWPEGDALVQNFVYKDGLISGFVDTEALTVNESKSTIINYDYFDIELPFTEGEIAITRGPRSKYFNVRYSVSNDDNVTITLKYKGCKTVDDVKAVDPDYLTNDIVDGVWSEGLGDLEDSYIMFKNCTNLAAFSSDLSSLTDGSFMFHYCSNLTSFNANLSSLMYGNNMFHNCSKLTSFTSDLSSLTEGMNMFNYCKLDASSVKNIIDTINTYSGHFFLGMGCNSSTADKNLFAQEAGYADMTSLLAALKAKGWIGNVQYNGRPTTTYSLRRPTEDTLPVFVKLEEVEEHADYTSADETKKYRLDWFHETTGSTDGYSQFNSLEEAIEALNIKLVERNI